MHQLIRMLRNYSKHCCGSGMFYPRSENFFIPDPDHGS
jgi:hypothetical protein